MNKTAIKNFAIWARNKLIADITYRAGLMGIAEDGIKAVLPQSTKDTEFYDIGTKEPHSITGEAVRQRRRLAELIEQKAKSSDYKTAYRSVLEEVAYTWFNRLVAIRFMEVNDYLPSRIRVLSSESKDKLEPDLVTTPFDADLELTAAETETIMRLKIDNQVDDLFRLLFVKQCNALNRVLPKLFEKTADYTELLWNVSVTDQDGVVYHLVHDIGEDDFNIEKGGQVEIIGWLYQYYNTEPKDEAFALLKKNVKITKERIPAATQLFTPDWIVRYMVENSLGRLWLEGHPNNDLKAGWKYYLDEAQQEAEVEAQLAQIREEYKKIKPEDIKVIDPCMGSGHILVYAFDVLMQIYVAAGYTQREAAKSILENNLYGLDIDDRAFQLAYFAVMMKARQYNRRILNGVTDCHVYAIQDSNDIGGAYQYEMGNFLLSKEHQQTLNYLLEAFKDAKEYGSILKLEDRDYIGLLKAWKYTASQTAENFNLSLWYSMVEEKVPELIEQAIIFSQKYDVVVTNPPYMGSSGMGSKLSDYVKKNYPDSKSDLFAVFMERCNQMAAANRYQAMITQHAWMFLSSFEKLRKKLLQVDTVNMAHLGARAFEEIGGEVVQTTSFVLRKSHTPSYKATYCRLIEPTTQKGKEDMFLVGQNRFETAQDDFLKIPGFSIAYWVSKSVYNAYVHEPIGNTVIPRHGLATSDNDRFLKLWFEINIHKGSLIQRNDFNKKWFPMNKGGAYRKWYGNLEWVINYEDNGKEIKAYATELYRSSSRTIQNTQYYFLEGITWSALTSGSLSFRWTDKGAIFGSGAHCAFTKEKGTLLYALGLMNSKINVMFLNIVSATMNKNVDDIRATPFILENSESETVCTLVKACLDISKTDWDSFETSWDFVHHPMVPSARLKQDQIESQFVNDRMEKFGKLSWDYENWQRECEERFNTLKANEEELNRIFIDIYGLQDELTPEVEDKDVTVRKADLGRDIRSLISYAVGCMFGRYSLDRPGLVFAGGDFDKIYWKYKGQAALDEQGEPIEGGYAGISLAEYHYPRFHDAANWEDATLLTFEPDRDNILPITDEEYFPDDIVGLFCAWLKKVYGEDTLEDNLDFIAKALGNKGNTSREIIRNYFLNDFFKDHCQTYSVTGSGKRPIYWLFDSGKQNGFKALVYMHRYDENTVGNLRIDYLHRMERVYDSEIARMQDIINNSKVAREITQATKRREKLQKQLKECKEYDERIAHLALARIPIDLDDGVKFNYEKVQTMDGVKYPVLAKI